MSFIQLMRWFVHHDSCANYSVIKNVAHLCGRSRSKMWGAEGWKKIVVCVVSDGRSKVNKRTLQVLSVVCDTAFLYPRSYRVLILAPRWDATKKVSRKIRWAARTSQPTSSSIPRALSSPRLARSLRDRAPSKSFSASRSRTRKS